MQLKALLPPVRQPHAPQPHAHTHMYISTHAFVGGHKMLYRIAIETAIWQGMALGANNIQV